MTLVKEIELNDDLKKEFVEFIELCEKEDGIEVSFKEDINDDGIIKYFFYLDDEIVAYVGEVKDFMEEKALGWIEINPKYRDEERIDEAIKLILEEVKKRDKKLVSLIVPEKRALVRGIIEKTGGEIQRTSYKMICRAEGFKGVITENQLYFREAVESDLDVMTEIGMEAFDTTIEEEMDYNKKHLQEEKFKCFVGEYQGKVSSMVSALITGEKASIADLAVEKEKRNKGLGREMLSRTVQILTNEGIKKMELGVVTENEKALNLYKSAGFEITQAHCTYDIEL